MWIRVGIVIIFLDDLSQSHNIFISHLPRELCGAKILFSFENKENILVFFVKKCVFSRFYDEKKLLVRLSSPTRIIKQNTIVV